MCKTFTQTLPKNTYLIYIYMRTETDKWKTEIMVSETNLK